MSYNRTQPTSEGNWSGVGMMSSGKFLNIDSFLQVGAVLSRDWKQMRFYSSVLSMWFCEWRQPSGAKSKSACNRWRKKETIWQRYQWKEAEQTATLVSLKCLPLPGFQTRAPLVSFQLVSYHITVVRLWVLNPAVSHPILPPILTYIGLSSGLGLTCLFMIIHFTDLENEFTANSH